MDARPAGVKGLRPARAKNAFSTYPPVPGTTYCSAGLCQLRIVANFDTGGRLRTGR